MVTNGRAGIDAALVRRLVAAQFPQWAGLGVAPVPTDGWDNRTYRLGAHLSVRLPTAQAYVPGVLKEQRWLPVLAPRLPLPIPEPLGLGRPGPGYPYPWSVRRWLPGETAEARRIDDHCVFAADLAGFLRVLRSLDTAGGPVAGAHSFFRGADLTVYDEDTRRCLADLAGMIPHQALHVWEAALCSAWDRPGVWFHGDVAEGNLLVSGGRLSAVIDFGTCGVGDPACDLVVAWTVLDAPARQVFRQETALDEDAWARARGWALCKALLGIAGSPTARGEESVERRVVDLVVAEHSVYAGGRHDDVVPASHAELVVPQAPTSKRANRLTSTPAASRTAFTDSL